MQPGWQGMRVVGLGRRVWGRPCWEVAERRSNNPVFLLAETQPITDQSLAWQDAKDLDWCESMKANQFPVFDGLMFANGIGFNTCWHWNFFLLPHKKIIFNILEDYVGSFEHFSVQLFFKCILQLDQDHRWQQWHHTHCGGNFVVENFGWEILREGGG